MGPTLSMTSTLRRRKQPAPRRYVSIFGELAIGASSTRSGRSSRSACRWTRGWACRLANFLRVGRLAAADVRERVVSRGASRPAPTAGTAQVSERPSR